MRSTGDDHRVAKAMPLHVVGGFQTQLVVRVANRCQESGLEHDGAFIVRKDKIGMKHLAHGVDFMIHLRLVPEVLEGDDFRFIAFRSCGVLGKRGTADEQTNDKD